MARHFCVRADNNIVPQPAVMAYVAVGEQGAVVADGGRAALVG